LKYVHAAGESQELTMQCLAETKIISWVHTLQVTRFTELAEFAIEKQDRRLKKSVSVSHIPQSGDETDTQSSISPTAVQKIQKSDGSARAEITFGRSMHQSPSYPTLSPRKFPSAAGQKGLMQRFLATRGKMGTLGTGFVTVKTSPAQTPVPVPPVTDNKLADTPIVERQVSINNPFEFIK
jgi:hypothetical protein